MSNMRKLNTDILYAVASIVMLILLWQSLSIALNKNYFPPFSNVIERFYENILNGIFVKNAISSLTRILVAMLISLASGFAVGILITWFRIGYISNFIKVLVFLSYPIPHITLLPILFYFFYVEWSKIVLISIIIFYPLTLSIIEWSSRFPRDLGDLIYVMGGGRFDLFRYVILPSSLPGILTGVRISFNTAYAVVFIVESLVGSDGLGYLIYNYWHILDYEDMYSAIIMLSILGVSTYLILLYLERKLLKWLY